MGAEAFITEVLHGALGAAHLACGPDFAFGHRRGGDVPMLARCAEAVGMGLTVVPPLADASGPISSTRIRRALQDGYPERATDDLGRPWSVRGTVAHGDALGRTIGFPTANIALGEQLEPARGVYAVTVVLDGRVVAGVANIGRRPTVAEGAISRVEAHLFDVDGDLYRAGAGRLAACLPACGAPVRRHRRASRADRAGRRRGASAGRRPGDRLNPPGVAPCLDRPGWLHLPPPA